MEPIFHLKISIRKVQDFIFQVPKLKFMLGANSLVGQFLCETLTNMRKQHPAPVAFRNNVFFIKQLSAFESANSLLYSEPAAAKFDNILENFRSGILTNTGGHFEVLFEDKSSALSFLKHALAAAEESIPGIKLSYGLKAFDPGSSLESFLDTLAESITEPLNNHFPFMDAPFFYPCPKNGVFPSLITPKRDDDNCKIVQMIEKQGEQFYKLKTSDFLCGFYKEYLLKELKILHDSQSFLRFELEEFAKLSSVKNNNLLAIIAIDGNNTGRKFIEKRKTLITQNVLSAFFEMEKFWYCQREKMRQALLKALLSTGVVLNEKHQEKLPVAVLMLGGDDLLVITVPEIAFNFIDILHQGLSEQDIAFAAGIAFAKYNYPFAQAHELAESLLASAKVKSKLAKDKKAGMQSAVDWHILYSTYAKDISAIRKSDYLLEYNNLENRITTEILTRRPYLITDALKIKKQAGKIATEILSKQDQAAGINKYRRFRYYIKQGHQTAQFYGKLLFEDKKNCPVPELFAFEQCKRGDQELFINNSLDIIELMDFELNRLQEQE